MKRCEVCKADYDESKPEEVGKHVHAGKHAQQPSQQGHPEGSQQPQPSGTQSEGQEEK